MSEQSNCFNAMALNASFRSTPNSIYPNEPSYFRALQRSGDILVTHPTRLSKILAHLGIASRRQCEEMIKEGRVKIDNVVTRDLFAPFVSDRMSLHIDGKTRSYHSERARFLFNKPANCLCSARGPGERVIDYFSDLPHRFFTVGRLDKETTGLIIVTNDGAFAHRIMHPRFGIAKEYEVIVGEAITPSHLRQLEKGALLDGVWVKPLSALLLGPSTVRLRVGEGRNREIRRLMSAAKLSVSHLTRIRLGQLELGALPLGHRRPMTEDECALATTADQLLLKRSKELSSCFDTV